MLAKGHHTDMTDEERRDGSARRARDRDRQDDRVAPNASVATSVLDRSEVIRSVCDALSGDRDDAARAIIKQQWPFVPIVSAGRRYTYTQRVRIFLRDGCIDRYKGHRLVFPGTLRLLSLRFPQELPFQPHWKMNECHQMWWELYPTIDHVVPIARGGVDDETNWVCVSMLTNAIKANWTLDELNWKGPLVPGQLAEWDGLTRWFLNQLDAHPELRSGDPPLRDWERAARLALA
jgi:5-methylcytosine-specific restriction endonuclease McrA